MSDPVSNKGFGDAALAERVVEVYAEGGFLDFVKFTGLGIDPGLAAKLEKALSYYSHGEGVITDVEEAGLVNDGFSRDFLKTLRGDDGARALRSRVHWLADHAEKKWWRWDLDAPDRRFALKILSGTMSISTDRIIAEETLPILAEILRNDPDRGVREQAANILTILGPAASPAVNEVIAAHLEEKISGHDASLILGGIGEPAVPALTEIIRDNRLKASPNDRVEPWPFEALSVMGNRGAEATPELLNCLESPIEGLRLIAIQTLIVVASHSPEIMQAVPPLLEDKARWPDSPAQIWVRRLTLRLVGRCSNQPGAHLFLPLLAEIRDNPEEEEAIRREAREAIEMIESKVL